MWTVAFPPARRGRPYTVRNTTSVPPTTELTHEICCGTNGSDDVVVRGTSERGRWYNSRSSRSTELVMPRIFSHHYDMHQCDACQGSDCVQPHRASLAGAEHQLPISTTPYLTRHTSHGAACGVLLSGFERQPIDVASATPGTPRPRSRLPRHACSSAAPGSCRTRFQHPT